MSLLVLNFYVLAIFLNDEFPRSMNVREEDLICFLYLQMRDSFFSKI